MEQLVKFISDSISDMTCRGGGSYERPAAARFFSADGKTNEGDDRRFENASEPRPVPEEKPDDPNGRRSLDDVEPSRSFSGEPREKEDRVGRRCSISPPVFLDACKFPESGVADVSQDVVQQSHVSSSKSPSVLANDIIGPLLLEALDGFLFMVDKRNEIQFISENVTQYLKYTKEDLIGNSIFNLIHVEDHGFFNQALEMLVFDPSCKSPSFTCRMLVKQPGKSQPIYDRMQITTTMQSYPFESKSNLSGNQLVACVARRIGSPKPDVPSTEIEQFTTKQDVKGVILDTCGLNPDNFGFSNLIGQNIQNFCHVNDKPQLFKHHREVLSSGTNTSGVYRFKLKEDKYVFVQTKSQLFKNPANPKLDFVMSTHSIVKECCDDNELKGSASSSLVKAIIGQAGNKSKTRHRQQSGEDSSVDYQSCGGGYRYHKTDVGEGEDSVKGMQCWRGGRGHHGFGTSGSDRLPPKTRGRGDRLTARPVGRPRLHPGGFASSRLHSQMSKSSEAIEREAFKRDGFPPAVWSNQRRRRRQQHYPLSNSIAMGCEDEIYSPCPLNKRSTGTVATDVVGEATRYDPDAGAFGSRQVCPPKELGFETSTSTDDFLDFGGSGDFLNASEQSFLDELLAETSEIGNSFLNDDFCMDFDDSILDEVAKHNPTNDFARIDFSSVENFGKPANPPRRNFNKPLSFAQSSDDISDGSAFKRADFRGTLADDRTHLTDLLVDGKIGERSRKEAWTQRIDEKKIDRGGSNSNIILKKLLSQEDEDNRDIDDDSQGNGNLESGGRVLALLTQGTAIGEVFPGGICNQLKKELENSFANNNAMNGNEDGVLKVVRPVKENQCSLPSLIKAYEDPKKLYHLGDKNSASALRSLEEALRVGDSISENAACKERQNVLLKELLNEKSNMSTPSVQSKLLKSLLASDEANFGALEEKCSSENKVGLLPIVEKNSEGRHFPGDSGRSFGGSGNAGVCDGIEDDFLSPGFSLDFDCYRDASNREVQNNDANVTFGSLNPGDPSSAANAKEGNEVSFEKSKEEIDLQSSGGKTFFNNSSSSFASLQNSDEKLFVGDRCNSASSPSVGHEPRTGTSNPSAFSFSEDRNGSTFPIRPSRKNVLLAQLLSRTSDDVLANGSAAASASCSIFPTRNASSIAVVTPMVHLLKRNENCSSPSRMGKEKTEESKERTEFDSKKDEVRDPFLETRPLAKPSASLHPFRRPPCERDSTSSPVPSTSEIFATETRSHYGGGTVERASGNKLSGDDASVGIVSCFDSSPEKSRREEFPRVDVGRRVSFSDPSSIPSGDLHGNDGFYVSGKVGSEPPNARGSSCNVVDALNKSNGQSSNVCSTKPFIAQPSLTSPVSLTSYEDPFSATYSPISPALQDENSQEVFSSNVTSNFLQVSTDNVGTEIIIGNDDVAEALSGNVNENLLNSVPCMSRAVDNQQTLSNGNCKEIQYAENNLFGFGYSGLQLQTNFPNPGNDWNDKGVDSNAFLNGRENHGRIVSGGNHQTSSIQERISRKRLHSEVFSLEQNVDPWHANACLSRGHPPSFDGIGRLHQRQQHQQQLMFQNHRMLGDPKRHFGMQPECAVESRPFHVRGRETTYGNLHVRFGTVQEVLPPSYQTESRWNQTRWTHAMNGTRHKSPYSPVDYQMLPRHAGSQMPEKIMVASNSKQQRQYFHSQLHLHHQGQSFAGQGGQNPVPSFVPQYEVVPNFTPEYPSCCNVSDLRADPSCGSSVYEFGNYSGRQHQSARHHRQLHQFANRPFLPQQFRTGSLEVRKLQHLDSTLQYGALRRSLPSQPQMSVPRPEHRSTSFCSFSSHPADQQRPHPSFNDALGIHPDSVFLDFSAEEAFGPSTDRRTSNPRDRVGIPEGGRLDSFDETLDRSAWGSDRNDLQFDPFDVFPTEERLRKERPNVRSRQQNEATDFSDEGIREPAREASFGGISEETSREDSRREVDEAEKKVLENVADVLTDRGGRGGEAEDVFESISFTDVESDMFWSNVSSGDDNKTTFEDLF